MRDATVPIFRGLFCLGVSLGLAWPASSPAAEPAARESSRSQQPARADGLEEVVVTAQKRSERAQETPISMTVLSGTALQDHSIATLSDITKLTPSIAATKSSNNQFAITFQIRGVSAIGSGESPVGIYVDDVYSATQSLYGTNGFALTGLLDVERIEVLKGPQGTLYGRNTAAGAVNVYSAAPTGELGGYGTANVGNHGAQTYTGVLNVPIVPDKLEARFAAQYGESDGYQHNVLGGDDRGAHLKRAARATFVYRPSDDWKLTLRGAYGKASGSGSAVQLIAVRPGSTMIAEAAAESGLPLTPSGLAAAQTLVDNYIRGTKPSLDSITLTPGTSFYRTGNVSLTAEYRISDTLSLKSISAYLEDNSVSVSDYDVTPFTVVNARVPNRVDQYTQELTLSGSAADDRLKYAVGAYYFDVEKTDNSIATAVPMLNPASPNSVLGTVSDQSYAAYAQGVYSLLDDLNLTLGVRYTDEKKELESRSHSRVSCLVPAADQIGGECLGRYDTSFTNTSYTAGLDYKLTPDVLLYAKVATGFKAGGTNAGSSIAGSYNNYDPETIRTYEGGIKSQFADDKVRLNLSYYYSKYDDLQKQVNLIVPPTNVIVTTVFNAAKATIKGVEFEGVLQPVRQFVLSSTVGYTTPKYDSFTDSRGDHSQQKFADTPKWTYSVSGAYTLPLETLGQLRTQVDWSWRSEVDLAPQDEANPMQNHIQKKYGLLDARASLHIQPWDADVSIWGKNLTDKLYFRNNTPQWSTLGYVLASVGDPRTYGVEISKRF